MVYSTMDNSAASAFVGAKSGGMLSKSFVGERAKRLYSVKTLRELHSLLFKGEVPAVPEIMLAKEIERKAEANFLASFVSLICTFQKPSRIFASLVHFYDYDNLKEIGAALSLGERKLPQITDTLNFSLLNYKAFPNLEKMTEGTSLAWYNKTPTIDEQQDLDSKLDSQYILELWNSANSLPSSEKEDVLRLIGAEIQARNILWVLRLKVFYKMQSSEIIKKLAFADFKKGKTDKLAGEAVKILEKDCSNFDDWKNWKYFSKLNSHTDGEVWQVDPVFVEKSFKKELLQMYSRSFHKKPLSILSLVAWFKIKQNELDSIRFVAEGLRLGVNISEFSDLA